MIPGCRGAIVRALLASLPILLGTACREPPPSIVLVTIDTLRADHASTEGYPAPTTPSLERLARRGVRFSRAFSASANTAPSHASIFTGVPPSWHSVGSDNGNYRLVDRETTLAEILRSNDFATAAIVSNPVLGRELGLDQGFETYDDALEGKEANRPERERYADRAVDLAIVRLEELAGRRFFLWLHLQDPHGPYSPPEKWRSFRAPPLPGGERELPLGSDQSGHEGIPRYQKLGEERHAGEYARLYDGEIGFADAELGRLLERLETDSRFAGVLVAVTADHGEALGEDGFFFAHGHSVASDQVRVPLVLAGKGLPAGVEVTTAVSNLSLFETALDFLRIAPAPRLGSSPAAPSLIPLARGEEPAAAPVFVEGLGQVGLVRDGLYLTRDRRPPEDLLFWRRNPNNESFWKPLGRRAVPVDGAASAARLASIEAELDQLDLAARAEAARIAPARVLRSSRPGLERELRGLGYLR